MNNRVRGLARALNSRAKKSTKYFVPCALGVIATFFVTTHLKPDLSVYFADGEVITYQTSDEANKFRTILVDWLDEDGPRIVSATDVTFRSANDVVRRSDRGRAWISKFVIENHGWVTAHHVTIGLGIPRGAESLDVIASPNITILFDKFVQTSANYPPYRKIDIERLGRNEQAVLTLLTACTCGVPSRSNSKDSELFIATEKTSKGYSPVLFLSSEEGTGQISGGLDIKDAFALEKRLYPTSTSGYWASSIGIANNAAVPSLEPADHVKITMSLDNEDGKNRELFLTYP